MKIVSIIGSRRKNGNSAFLARTIAEEAEKDGAGIEHLFLGDFSINACTGCEGCSDSWDCIIRDDYADLTGAIDAADAVILVSPTYWYSVTSDMKRFIDRSYSLIQYPESRRRWTGKYADSGKLCVTAAVCEQSEEAMMGNTLTLLNSFARDIGLTRVASVAARGFFEAGSIARDGKTLQEARQSGALLVRRHRAS